MNQFSPDKILAPVDFSSFSDEALRMALSIGHQADAEVTVLHVMEEPPPPSGLGASPGYFPARSLNDDLQRKRAEIELESRERLNALLKEVAGEPAKVKSVLVWSDPTEEIVRLAKDEDTDLIVMSTHGRTGIKRLYMGSVTERVIRQAPCPLLVLRGEMSAENGGGKD